MTFRTTGPTGDQFTNLASLHMPVSIGITGLFFLMCPAVVADGRFKVTHVTRALAAETDNFAPVAERHHRLFIPIVGKEIPSQANVA